MSEETTSAGPLADEPAGDRLEASPIEASPIEAILLERSTDLAVHRRRAYRAVLIAVGAIVVLVTIHLSESERRADLLFWLFVVYILLATYDKICGELAVSAYKRLVQKLVHALVRSPSWRASGSGEKR